MNSVVVCDTATLISLAKVGQLDLLTKLFDEIFIADVVQREFQQGAPPEWPKLADYPWIKVKRTWTVADLLFPRSMLGGEAATLVLAQRMHATAVLFDEPRHWLKAKHAGFIPLKTFDVFLMAKGQQHITKVKPLLDALRLKQVVISDKLYQEVLSQAGEDVPPQMGTPPD